MLTLYESLEGYEAALGDDTVSIVTESTVSEEVWLPRVLILYGSETGKAEALSRKLKQLLRALKPTLLSLNEATGLNVAKVKNITHLLCVTSTFGKGEAPRNAQEFFNADIPELPSVFVLLFLLLAVPFTPTFAGQVFLLIRSLLELVWNDLSGL